MLAVQVGLRYGVDQGERALASLVEQRLDPSKGLCSGGVDGATR
jgi:hypothetical protein